MNLLGSLYPILINNLINSHKKSMFIVLEIALDFNKGNILPQVQGSLF